MSDPSDSVTVLVSRDATELTIAQSLLRSEGIESVIRNERRASLPFPTGLPAALGGGRKGARLDVERRHEDAARELLLAFRDAEPVETDTDEPSSEAT